MDWENEAFTAFHALAQRFVQGARPLPAQVDFTPVQTAVCFSVLGHHLAVSLNDLSELLEVPSCTGLPRVQPWVKGVANVRGKLLPIIDFPAYLGGRLVSPPKQQRILVIDSQGVFVGLQVDNIQGMRHFRVDRYQQAPGGVPESLGRYVAGSFAADDDSAWLLFDPHALVGDSMFMSVAV